MFVNGKAVAEKRAWSIEPVCACFNMNDIGMNCCCAHAFMPCSSITWGNSLKYAGVGSTYATVSNLVAQIDLGDSGLAQGVEAAARLNALLSGMQKRRELTAALGLRRDANSFLLRLCCGGCLQCQEVDTVFAFYRDSLGYSDLRYGSCWTCSCTRWYTNIPSADDPVHVGPRVVPFPDEIYRGESVGPNYKPEDLQHGYYFEAGVPKPYVGPRVQPPSQIAPLRNPNLHGYLQPPGAVK
jgi:hypothetical protein